MSGSVLSQVNRIAAGGFLLVNDRDDLAGQLRAWFPDAEIREAGSYLAAIRALGESSASVILACVDPAQDELREAVGGLREAAGADAKLVLCCRAEAEPAARDALDAGADDYLICPLRREELDEALGAGGDEVADSGGAPTVLELEALGDILGRLDGTEEDFLKSLAELLRTAFDADGAGVVVAGTAATSGGGGAEPAMTEPIMRDGSATGHVAIGPPSSGSYGASDRAKLRHYARLIGNLIAAAGERRTLHDLAYTDELSGLPNRRYLLQFLDRALKEAKEKGTNVSVLMFDVDCFKRYNDEFGHDAGDEIIKACGVLFQRNCREHDVVTRYGGDEFAVVFWDKGGRRVAGSSHPVNVLPLIERCRRSLPEHNFGTFKMRDGSRLTISGGLATFPDDASTAAELITRADEALLRAKRDGKNRIFIGGANGGPALGAERSDERDA